MLKELNKMQWVFVVFLALMTALSIVAEFSGGHGAQAAHETKAVHGDAQDVQDAPAVQETHDTQNTHETQAEPVAGGHVAQGSHGAHWWASVPFFWIWFGAVGCAVLILFGKKVLGPVIYKKEDYYNE